MKCIISPLVAVLYLLFGGRLFQVAGEPHRDANTCDRHLADNKQAMLIYSLSILSLVLTHVRDSYHTNLQR